MQSDVFAGSCRLLKAGFLTASFFFLIILSSWCSLAKAQQLTTGPAPVINGTPVENPNKYPWYVALVRSSAVNVSEGLFCGGSLVAPDRVLTAAHCVQSEPTAPSDIDVVVGSTAIGHTPSEQRIHVAGISVHPKVVMDEAFELKSVA